MRVDRIELAIVLGLMVLVAQLWAILDLPRRLRGDELNVVKPAHAEVK